MINFKSIPFLKIIVPYLIGIIIYNWQSFTFNPNQLFVVVSFLFLLSFIIVKLKKPSTLFYKTFFTLCSNLFLLILAFVNCYYYSDKNNSNHYTNYLNLSNQKIIGYVNESPSPTKNGYKFNLQLKAIEQNNKWHYCEGKLLIYCKKDSTLSINIGDELLLNGSLKTIINSNNPYEFDYKLYLERKNIYHTLYGNTTTIVKLSNTANPFSLTQIGAKIQFWVINTLRKSNLSEQAFSICSALLVGYDSEIDDEVINSFTHSGTLHILSVSGLHTGVIYGILLFLFSVFDKHNRFNQLRCFSVIAILILFVFVTGISPSVLRASVMLTFMLIGKTYFKQSNSYNTLLLSAFVLLIINPLLIYNIGFLLSYFAVFGIMYFYPKLSNLFTIHNPLLKWIWNSAAVSIAATLFTLPISLYSFHQFPIWFVIANVVIIPISILILFASIAVVVFFKVAIVQSIISFIINKLTDLMLWLVSFTDHSTYGYIDGITFSETDVLFCSLTIVLFLSLLENKRYHTFAALLFTLIFWLSLNSFEAITTQSESELIIYKVQKKSAYTVRIGDRIYLNKTPELNKTDFERTIKPYITSIVGAQVDSLNSDLIVLPNTIITSIPESVLNEQHKQLIILAVNNNLINVSLNFKQKPLIVADCSNSNYHIKKLQKQCEEYNVPFYNIKEQGAFKLQLKN